MKQYRKVEEVLELLSPMQIAVAADIYENGDGVTPALPLALSYYRIAAERGVPYAQYKTAMLTSEDDGALLWLHMSAKQGLSVAMKELSDRLVRSDPKASKKWLRKYYRSRYKTKIRQWFGKGYQEESLPEVIDGEVVILI